jgi:hypothetical protein
MKFAQYRPKFDRAELGINNIVFIYYVIYSRSHNEKNLPHSWHSASAPVFRIRIWSDPDLFGRISIMDADLRLLKLTFLPFFELKSCWILKTCFFNYYFINKLIFMLKISYAKKFVPNFNGIGSGSGTSRFEKFEPDRPDPQNCSAQHGGKYFSSWPMI